MKEITKREVAASVANILLRLGKNDFQGTRIAFDDARKDFEQWVEERPERQSAARREDQREQ